MPSASDEDARAASGGMPDEDIPFEDELVPLPVLHDQDDEGSLADSEGFRWLERDDVTHLPYLHPLDLTPFEAEGKKRESKNMVSVLVLAHRSHVHLPHIIRGLLAALNNTGEEFEIVVADEGAFYVNTREYLEAMSAKAPIRLLPLGKKGLVTSVELAQLDGNRIVIFDADMRLTAQSVEEAVNALEEHDVVAAYPGARRLSLLRGVQMFFCKLFSLPLRPLLAGSMPGGLRAYKRSVLDAVEGMRGFRIDLEFDAQALYNARRLDLSVAHVSAALDDRYLAAWTYRRISSRVVASMRLWHLRVLRFGEVAFPFTAPPEQAEFTAAGFTNVRDYLFLSENESAKRHITKETVALLWYVALFLVGFVGAVSYTTQQSVFRVVVELLSVVYLSLFLLKVYVTSRSRRYPYFHVSEEDIAVLEPDDLPLMSIFIPLYKEQEIIPQIFHRIAHLDYPIEKLDIIFILESNDTETIEAFKSHDPPAYFKALLCPDVLPKTKPKALNVAFQKSRGDIIVIYDAEVLPEVDQLKKVCVAMKKNPGAMYVHTRLNVYNAEYNWLTKLYTAEFAFYYDFFITGLVSLNVPLPISGHSIYFKREVIEKVGAWDPYNVAEDCDIGIRIFRHGFGSGLMLDSFAWEQSTTTVHTWIAQRTRWYKGFLQTTMVHLRFPMLLKHDLGSWRNFFWFLVLVPGNTLINALNLFQTVFLLLYLATRWVYIEEIYAGLPLYIATFSFITGNYLFTYFNLIGLYSRKEYNLVLTAYFTPGYWLLLGYATMRSIFEFFLHPFSWSKTTHFTVNAPRSALA